MPNNLYSCEEFISRDQLITCLYKSEELRKSILVVVGKCATCPELAEELRSELFLSLCELAEDQLKQMHSNGYLDYYIVRTLRNMFDSNTSRFYKKIKKEIIGRSEIMPFHLRIADEAEEHIDPEQLNKALTRLNWFEREVLDRYIEYGSVVKVCNEAGVSSDYATRVLNSARKKIKDALH